LAAPVDRVDRATVDYSTHVVLVSGDVPPVDFVLSMAAAKLSGLLSELLDERDGVCETVLPVPNVDARVLRYVVEYLEHHAVHPSVTISRPLKGTIRDKGIISEWDTAFLFTDLVQGGDVKKHKLLVDCVLAANFLNIQSMLDLTCAAVADIIKGHTPDEIRDLFAIANDFTPEEEGKLRSENRWCESA
jgi:S-phase kinase-associated protein 1